MNRKTEFKPEMLCRGLPDEFRQYFEYVRGLAFTKRPDYAYLKGLFHKVMMKLDLINDSGFDWCTNVSLCLIIFIIQVKPFDFYKDHVPKYDMSTILNKLSALKRKESLMENEEEDEVEIVDF